jgi:hypothetical protein
MYKTADDFKKEFEKFNNRLADLDERATLLNEKLEKDILELEKMFEVSGVA